MTSTVDSPRHPERPAPSTGREPDPRRRKAVDWKCIAIALLLAVAATSSPSHALFDPGNVGLPSDNPGLDPGDPPQPPPPPPPPSPLVIRSVGVNFVELVVRPPAGQISQLLKQPPGGAFEPFGSLSAGVETVIRDEDLGVGKGYCYRLTILGGGARPDENHTRCATTDWRVGFEGLGISPAESAEVLRLFDWRDTQALPEGTEAEPALYHMNLLIEGGDPLAEQGFRTMGMHVQAQPIFYQELEGWNDAQALARTCDGTLVGEIGPVATTARSIRPVTSVRPVVECVPLGRWYFAAVPGRIYNEIRTRMLEQIGRGETPGVRALVFRRIPVAAGVAVGVTRHVLNYVYLGQQGFEFNAIRQCFELEDGTRVCQIQQELLGWIARKVVHWVVELGDAVVEGVRSAIGRISRLIKGEVTLDLDFRLLNTDPAFGTDQVMRSGWSGQELKLADVRVEVRQGLAGFYENTDANGHVRLKVAKNADTKVCVQVENDTAEVTEFLIEKTVCVANIGQFTADARRTIDARHNYLNTLAAMTDAREYLHQVAGFTMPKITVLVGGEANELAVQDRSFAPCMGRAPSLLGVGTDLLGLLGPAWLAVGVATEFTFSVDIVLQPGDDRSRGVPVHEYGHTVMCEMLLRQGLDAFEIAWTDVIIATSSQTADNQASYLNEAFADFITAQVLGGTNYFSTVNAIASESVNYCPAGGSCVENNFNSTGDFKSQVARIVSTLHDAFDGHAAGAGPNDASHWLLSPPFAHVFAVDSDANDEVVALAGSDLRTLFEHWDARGTLLREDNFMGGLADLAEERGYAESDVCALFALHDASATCPGFVARPRPWLGWLDGASGGLLTAFAAAPAPTPGASVRLPIGETRPALMTAIASLQPAPAPSPAPTPGTEPDAEACEGCAAPVVLAGVQKIQLPGLGKHERETAFAFRLGEGSFEGIDPLGQLYRGAWKARNAKGSTLRLYLAPESSRALANLLAESAEALGVDAVSLRAAGPAKIELRLATGGALVGEIAVAFTVDVDGRTRRGTYVAKLRGPVGTTTGERA